MIPVTHALDLVARLHSPHGVRNGPERRLTRAEIRAWCREHPDALVKPVIREKREVSMYLEPERARRARQRRAALYADGEE